MCGSTKQCNRNAYNIPVSLGSQFPLQMIYSGSRVLWTPWDRQKCPDYQGVLIFLVILYDKVQFGTSTKCLGYAGVRNRFDCNSQN